MDSVLEILHSILPNIDVEGQTALFDDGILNSFDIVELISRLCDTFDIKIRAKYLVPENFNSADAIWKMVQTILDE